MSESTVSRVVNDRPGVKDVTRAAVRRAIEELGYQQPGLRLRQGVGFVGLITPELQNPIFPAFAQAIENGLVSQGIVCVLCASTQSGLQEFGYLDLLVAHGVAGIIVVSGMNANTEMDHEIYARLLNRGMPMVFLNGYVEGLEATFVSADDRHAAHVAVNHLAALGHRRIGAVMGPHRYVPVQRRRVGYEEAMEAAFGAGNELFVAESIFTVEGGAAAARSLLDAGCTALVCAGDLMALGAIRAVEERQLDVPRDVSVVGFDDTLLMGFVDPALTTVRQPVQEMSETVVRVLLEQIAGLPARRHEYLFRPELVVRASTGPCRSEKRVDVTTIPGASSGAAATRR